MPTSRAAAERLCRVRTGTPSDEVPFTLDGDGFLAQSHDFSWASVEPSDGALITADTAARSGAFVLLGEPGVGKSTVLRALTDDLPSTDDTSENEPCLLWLDGTDLTDNTVDRLLCRYLERLPPATRPEPHGPAPGPETQPVVLTIVIDQLDESALLPNLAGRIRHAVKDRDVSGLRWLIACRAVDYPTPLTRQLAADGRSVVVADLAPLSREHAVLLAGEFGVDGEALVASAVGAGAGALASIPLTLQLLAKLSHSGGLTGTAQDLFHRSVRQLLSEPRGSRGRISVQADQLFAVASRVAARVVLSGRRTIWTGDELVSEGSRGEVEVRAGTLVAGQEKVNSAPFEVTDDLVYATLTTAVFAPRGGDRLAFSHSSIAAYLAAWHLRTWDTPEHQLRSLFLVAANDGSVSVPSSLRETAAWLITLEPSHAAWLTDADPRSLASYSNLVDNPETRGALVTAMLRRAGELELSDLPWRLDQTRLSYPGLADDLAQVLNTAESAPESWPDRARSRLAVRLAVQADATDGLIEALLAVVESPHWDAHERRLAVGALGDIAPAAASARLRQILDTELADPVRRAATDPDDEIRGGILFALWPGHLTLEEALAYLAQRSDRRMAGLCSMFLRDLPVRVDEDDVPKLLDWARRSAGSRFDPTTSTWRTDGDATTETIIARSADDAQNPWASAKEMIEPLLDRATSWEHGGKYLEQVASLVWPTIHADHNVSMPGPLAVVGPDGVEPTAAQHARRGLCLELCRYAKAFDTSSLTAIRIVNGWTPRFRISSLRHSEPGEFLDSKRASLVDHGDFAWSLSEAERASAAGDNELAFVLAHIASYILDPNDEDALELAFTYENTPLWAALRGHFDAIPLNSDLARALRRNSERARTRNEPAFEEAEDFRDKIRSDLDLAAAGDTTAFWHLLWNMQFDPESGRGHAPATIDDPRQLPAASLIWPPSDDRLLHAAMDFVINTHDHRAEWLGTDHYDKRAWAGYLALALIDRLGLTTELPDHVWGSWVGALLWFTPAREPDDGPGRRHRLIAKASQHTFDELDNAIPTYVVGEIARGSEPNEVNLDDGNFVLRHRHTFHNLAAAIQTALQAGYNAGGVARSDTGLPYPTSQPAPALQLGDDSDRRRVAGRTLGNLMRALLSVRHSATEATAMATIQRAPTTGPITAEVICADSLLRAGGVDLATIIHVLHENRHLGVQLARHIGTGSNGINHWFDEDQLAQILAWLETLPRTAPERRRTSWTFGNLDGVEEWRRQTLRDLTNRRTPAALERLNALSAQFPEQLDIAAAVLTVRTAVHASLWKAPHPDDIAELLTNPGLRLVRTNRELASLLLHTLTQVAKELPTHGELLWDRQRPQQSAKAKVGKGQRRRLVGTWRPKPEAAFCAYIAHELRIRLRGRGVAINREVLVKPTDPYGAGDRTDIQVEAFPKQDPRFTSADDTATRLAVVIEAKGQWNPGLEDDLVGQLAGRYLAEFSTDTGIYLVGWFPLDQWDDTSDTNRPKAAKRELDRTRTLLKDQTTQLVGKHVSVQIVEVPRPQKNDSSI